MYEDCFFLESGTISLVPTKTSPSKTSLSSTVFIDQSCVHMRGVAKSPFLGGGKLIQVNQHDSELQRCFATPFYYIATR